MPAYRQEKQLSFERIEKPAVKTLLEKMTSQELFKRKPCFRDRPFGERSPTGEEQLIGILYDVHFAHRFRIVEQIVAIERPLIESRGVVVVYRAVIEQERCPTQTVQH